MSKVIVVTDKPNDCEHCPCFSPGMFYGVCELEKQTWAISEKEKPNWCPLREVPQKKDKDKTHYDTDYNYALGYNDCIDEILGK